MKKVFIYAFVLLALTSCNKKDEAPVTAQAQTQTKVYNSQEIRVLFHKADSLFNLGQADTALMNQYVNLALEHVQKEPADTFAPDFLLYAGIFEMKTAFLTSDKILCNQIATHAIDIFNQLIDQYPNYKNLDYCYFYKGNIYENLQRFSDAEDEYRELVHQFPESDLSKGMEEYIKAKGFSKTPDELMNDIAKKKQTR